MTDTCWVVESISVFHYNSPRSYLVDAVSSLKKRNSRLSIRALSRIMGLRSHTLLAMLLKGQRKLHPRHIAHFAKGLKLTPKERLYLQALVQFESASGSEEKEACRLWLAELHPQGQFESKELDEFQAISHWVYTAILAMTHIPGFKGEPEEVHRRFGGRVTLDEAKASVKRLFDLGLLLRTADGRVEKAHHWVTTKNDVKNEGARLYFQRAFEEAKTAIELSPLQRELQSFSLAIEAKDLPLAQEMVRKFRAQFSKTFSTQSANQVFQMNIQFFPLTENPPRGPSGGSSS